MVRMRLTAIPSADSEMHQYGHKMRGLAASDRPARRHAWQEPAGIPSLRLALQQRFEQVAQDAGADERPHDDAERHDRAHPARPAAANSHE